MKIVDLRVHLTHVAPMRTWVLVEIETADGIVGVGESTNAGGSGALVVGQAYELLRDDIKSADFSEGIVGQDSDHIEKIWQMVYRRFGTLGSRGFATTLCSGIDTALWDIKGKALGRPVYDLLGGPLRDSLLLYTHIENTNDIDLAVAEARQRVSEGYTALKTDPFNREMRPKHRRYIDGKISAQGAEFGDHMMGALRKAVGPNVELMIDAHGNFDLPTATQMCNRMLKHDLTWFEEPLQPEGVDALKQLRSNTDMPLCAGERKYTRWDILPLLKDGLVNFVMRDPCWTGGISEVRKIAILAEAFYVPVTPHDASGPFNILAGAHAMMSVPNFYRLEYSAQSEPLYNGVLTEPLDIRGGYLCLPNRPGLGYELNHDFIRSHPDPEWERLHGR